MSPILYSQSSSPKTTLTTHSLRIVEDSDLDHTKSAKTDLAGDKETLVQSMLRRGRFTRWQMGLRM